MSNDRLNKKHNTYKNPKPKFSTREGLYKIVRVTSGNGVYLGDAYYDTNDESSMWCMNQQLKNSLGTIHGVFSNLEDMYKYVFVWENNPDLLDKPRTHSGEEMWDNIVIADIK